MKRLLLGVAFATTTATALPARADDASTKAAAQSLFDEGRRLMAAGKYGEACPKFAESQRLDGGAGTLMNLADCYEKDGRLASAWATYNEAVSASAVSGRTQWSAGARAKVAALRPKLATMTIVLGEPTPGLEITRDGAKVSSSELEVSVPVDAGHHTLEARAPNRRPWRKEIDAPPTPTDVRIVIPRLEPAPAVATTVVAPKPSAPRGRPQRLVGWIGVGVGAAGIVGGGVLGLLARSRRDDALARCSNDGAFCDSTGVDDMASARGLATGSTIAFVAGGIVAAAGVVLVLTAPSGERAVSVRLGPSFTGAHVSF